MKHLSDFTVCLTMVIVMIAGAALLPRLDVGIKPPPRQGKTLTVSYSWRGVSAQVIEHGVTSVIEGVTSGVKGVESVSSESFFGRGKVYIHLKKTAEVSAVRFEIASMLRQIYPRLPEGVSYPSLSGGEVVNNSDRKNENVVLLTYNINADMSEENIIRYVEHAVMEPLNRLDGVKRVDVTGSRRQYMELSYNPRTLAEYGITPEGISEAIRSFTGRTDIVGDIMRDAGGGHMVRQTLCLSSSGVELSDIPVRTAAGQTVYLNTLVECRVKRAEPDRYYRINGQNTVNLNVMVNADDNLIFLSSAIRDEIRRIKSVLSDDVSLTLAYDAAEEERVEVYNLVSRSLLSLLILLVLVWVARREWRYLFIIASTLAASILLAVIAYYASGLRLHVFSMAGIAVSMGLIIDASIVMADHYGYYHDRRAFLAILAAMLTTMGSLVTVYFLPEAWQADLYDFSRIIVINLAASLVVSLLFVPALIGMMKYDSMRESRHGHVRRILKWNKVYLKYIMLTQRHKWIAGTLLVLAFGIPLFALPDHVGTDDAEENPWYCNLYNGTIGSRFVRQYCIEPLEVYVGGSLRMFVEALGARYRDEDEQPELFVRGQLPQGGTATELNHKVVMIESFLRQCDGIKRFTTRIDGRGALIDVVFQDSCLTTSLPYMVENKVIGKLISIGGADWATYGVSRIGFSNSLNLQHRSNRIWITGYNFDRLNRYAGDIVRYVSGNSRVRDVIVEIPGHEDSEDELYMKYGRERMALYGVEEGEAYSALAGMLQEKTVGEYDDGRGRMDVLLKPVTADAFDRWHIDNSYIKVAGRDVKVSDIMEVEERSAKKCIPKRNQEYVLAVAFNVLGSYSYIDSYVKETIGHFNSLLPMGYRCTGNMYDRADDTSMPYWIIAVVVIIIFFICAILFESLRLSFAIVLTIPVSFIGLFVTFRMTDMDFGTGGFASMMMLAGIVVNSGIYIVSEYRMLLNDAGRRKLPYARIYIKAYNHKIIPVLLTVLSTVAGLVPFLLDGEEAQFWRSFAIGVCGGLLFSVFVIVFVMPLLLNLRPDNRKKDIQK